jgi:hypothetical protein
VHVVGFIIEIYHDGRSHERKIVGKAVSFKIDYCCRLSLDLHRHFLLS